MSTAPEPGDREDDDGACPGCAAEAAWLDDVQALVARISAEAELRAPEVRAVRGGHFTACVRDHDTPTPVLIFDEKAHCLTLDQLAGVIAHELGHIANPRPRYRLLSAAPWVGVMFGMTVCLAALLTGVQRPQLTPTLQVAAAGLLVMATAMLAQAVLYARHRRYELLADSFARELGYGPHLVRFLAGPPGRKCGAAALTGPIADARAVRLPRTTRIRDLFGRTHPRYHVRILALVDATVLAPVPVRRIEAGDFRALSGGELAAR